MLYILINYNNLFINNKEVIILKVFYFIKLLIIYFINVKKYNNYF